MSQCSFTLDDAASAPCPGIVIHHIIRIFAVGLVLSSTQFVAADNARAESLEIYHGHGEVLTSQSGSTGGEGSASTSVPSQRWYPKVGTGADMLWNDGGSDPLFPGLSVHVGAGVHSHGEPLDWRDWIPLHGFEMNLHHTRFGLSGEHEGQTATFSGLSVDGRF